MERNRIYDSLKKGMSKGVKTDYCQLQVQALRAPRRYPYRFPYSVLSFPCSLGAAVWSLLLKTKRDFIKNGKSKINIKTKF